MAIERRLRTTKGRRKVYSYRVKWRYQGNGPWQSKTVDSDREAGQLEDALAAAKWNFLSTDPEVKYLGIIGATMAMPATPDEAKAAQVDLTLADAVYRWANRAGLSDGSKRIYNQCHSRLGPLGLEQLADVTAEDIEDWFNQQGKQLASNTMQVMRIAMRGALAVYGRQDLTANLAKVRASRDVVPVYLTPLELDALVAKAEDTKGHNFAVLVRLVGTMGLRWGEVMALTVGDLELHDLDHAALYVRRAIKNDARLEDGFRPAKVKATASTRLVPLSLEMAKLLADMVRNLPRDAVVFKPATAAFWNHRTFIYQWRTLTRSTPEVPTMMRFHDLRHTAAKNLLEVNMMPIAALSQLLGHSKVDITIKEYGQFDRRSQDMVRSLLNA